MNKIVFTGFFIFVLFCFAGCESKKLPGPAAGGKDAQKIPRKISRIPVKKFAKILAEFNKGAAYLEQYQYSKAAKLFKDVLKEAPEWTAARFNLGLAYLNMPEDAGNKKQSKKINGQEQLERAREAFEMVLKTDPTNPYALYSLGMYYQNLGNVKKTLDCYKAVYDQDKKDPFVMFKYAGALSNSGRVKESTKLLEELIGIDPGFLSGIYQLALQYRRLNKKKESMALFKRFADLRAMELTGGTFAVNKPYGSAGKYYMALGADSLPLAPLKSNSSRLLFSPEVKNLAVSLKPWQWKEGEIGLAGIACGDIDGDGDLDLCLTCTGAEGEVSTWINNGDGTFTRGETICKKGVSPSFGDFDNDGDPDLWLGCAGQDLFFKNDGKGNFTKVDNPSLGADNLLTTCARFVDLDSDGDLDFLAFRLKKGSIPYGKISLPAQSRLYNNNRDGTFKDIAGDLGLSLPAVPVAASVYDDFDNDNDLDLAIFPADDKTPLLWINDRVWKYKFFDSQRTGLTITNVQSAVSGDPDKDGDRDLLVFSNGTTKLFKNQGDFNFKEDEDFTRSFGSLGGSGGQFADMDNDGDLDIVISDAKRRDGSMGPAILINDYPMDRFLDASIVDPGIMISAIKTGGKTSCVVADFTGDGKCDIFCAPVSGKPFLIKNITAGGNWVEFDFAGTRTKNNKTRSNNSAIGARVEIKTGRLFQQYTIGIPSGTVAMPPFRIHAGLGDCDKIDWLRIIWPDAVLQAELELPANRVTRIKELQRKTSSCPVLFAWDGKQFEFVSDFAGVGGLGFLVAPGVYAPPDPTEYLKIPGLKPLNGEYVLQAIENLEEVVYFDEVKLIAVDHPAGTTVYPNEMMPVNSKPPAYNLFCYGDTIDPVKVIDNRGKDITKLVSEIDRRCGGATDLSPPFMGVAGEHFVDLDFGNRLNNLKPSSRLVLFLYGWVEYGYSSTNFAASQAGVILHAPSIHVLRNNNWVELFKEVGYPAGLNHMMTLEVTGKILPGDRKIRISSNMELYWDRIFLAQVLDKKLFSQKEIPLKSADLHFKGYPREYTPDGRQPNIYDYNNIDTAVAWKLMPGEYTRYGEVAELLNAPDDCYVIMGRGEEITFRFPVDALGPVPKGKERSFILKTDSFCKDMDLYTAFPNSVGPLPFHGMSGYPYRADEHYPDNEKTRAYRRKYNTRNICTKGPRKM